MKKKCVYFYCNPLRFVTVIIILLIGCIFIRVRYRVFYWPKSTAMLPIGLGIYFQHELNLTQYTKFHVVKSFANMLVFSSSVIFFFFS